MEIEKELKKIKKRKLNENKKWTVQFSFRTNDDHLILEIMSDTFPITSSEEYRFIDKSPANVSSFKKTFQLNNKELEMHKLEYDAWDSPMFTFNFDEPVENLQDGSIIEQLDSMFKTEKSLNYKLVNYGIL
jgi:hypothetical protein